MEGSQRDTDIPEPTLEEQVEFLRRELQTLHSENRRRAEELMGILTILCLPMSNKRRMEIGFSVVKNLSNEKLGPLLERYIKEAMRSEMGFDEIFEPMIKTVGFERLWKLIDKRKIQELFGELTLGRWIEMGKSHPCEG